jgi:RimJ/RimL family protein N-acetyltransferase
MKFYSDKFPIPELFQADKFIFRPLRASDVELDFDAVISSSHMLRAWSQSDWPVDGFTLEENLDDLQRHEQEHLDKKAFTYTIMNPEGTFCLGCIYMNPLIQETVDLGICQHPAKDEEVFAASVRYWVRESHATKEFNSTILEKIIQWLDSEWYFNCVVFPVAITDSMQTQLFVERGFVLVGKIYYERGNSHWNIYQKNSE